MIFSEHNWNKAEEIRAFVKVNTAVSFAMLETPLNNAFNLFLKPLLGPSLSARLVEIYNNDAPKDTEEELLRIAQRANANLALWYEFDAISVRITDAGFQRQESENGTFKPAYKYQEDNLRQSYKNKGFNALDEMLDFLYLHISDFPEFADSNTYKNQQSAIVRSTADVNNVVFINNSRLIFLRLQTHLKFVETMLLIPAIGEDLYNHLIDSLLNDPVEEIEKKHIDTLRKACANYIVVMAVRRLMMETGSLTDRGLYFTTVEAGEKGNEKRQPLETDRIAIQIQNLKADADMYMGSLQRVISAHFPEFHAGNPQRVFDRDNDHKRTFWA